MSSGNHRRHFRMSPMVSKDCIIAFFILMPSNYHLINIFSLYFDCLLATGNLPEWGKMHPTDRTFKLFKYKSILDLFYLINWCWSMRDQVGHISCMFCMLIFITLTLFVILHTNRIMSALHSAYVTVCFVTIVEGFFFWHKFGSIDDDYLRWSLDAHPFH